MPLENPSRLPSGEVGTLTGGDIVSSFFLEKNENMVGLRLDLGDFSSGPDAPKEVGASTHRAGAILSSPRNDLPESFVLGLTISSSSSIRSLGSNVLVFGAPVRRGSADRVMGRWFDRLPRGSGGTGGASEANSCALLCLVRLAERCLYLDGLAGVAGSCIGCACVRLFERYRESEAGGAAPGPVAVTLAAIVPVPSLCNWFLRVPDCRVTRERNSSPVPSSSLVRSEKCRWYESGRPTDNSAVNQDSIGKMPEP